MEQSPMVRPAGSVKRSNLHAPGCWHALSALDPHFLHIIEPFQIDQQEKWVEPARSGLGGTVTVIGCLPEPMRCMHT
jgi:hypothetical protein